MAGRRPGPGRPPRRSGPLSRRARRCRGEIGVTGRPLRLFVAVPLPEATRRDVARVLDPIAALPGAERVRWVRTESLHLTLRFLGSTPPEQVDGLARAVDIVADAQRRSEVVLGGGGAFPSRARPRVLWIGITAGGEQLERMAHALSVELVRLGWPPEGRPFRAHLTVARTDAVPHAIGSRVADELANHAAGWTSTFQADRIVLFQSHLGGGPARYTALHEAALAD